MYRFFAEQSACKGEYISIGGADWNHMKNVLRLKTGEQVTVSDGSEREYICEIAEYLEDEARLRVLDILDSAAELPTEITLYQGFPKGDKLELIIQKAVELGAVRIVPVMTKRSIVKLDEKKAANKVKRWQAIAESAAKQSKRTVIPEVKMPVSWKEAVRQAKILDITLVPYENERGLQATREIMQGIPDGATIGVMIGPEGGFSPEEIAEVDGTMHRISLGRRILRTETAGLATLSMLIYTLDV